ncbi:hypothetical protein ACFL4G_13235 [Thermodesulfobacteriota bacterium]
MERSAIDDDMITCPICGTREHLTLKWIPGDYHRVHERIEIGCAVCNKWFSAKEDRWAFAQWNNFAIEEWRNKGVEQPNAELYRLLLEHCHDEMAERESAEKVDVYLIENIVPQCPFDIGERFKSSVYRSGIWSVREVIAVYGTNTGPFWIIKARNVKPNGRLGNSQHEFWQRDVEHLHKLSPFCKPTRWSQLVAGDECIHEKQTGTLISVDVIGRTASISIKGNIRDIHNLTDLYIPIVRFEDEGI